MSRPARRRHGVSALITFLVSLPCASCVFARIFYYNVPTLSAPHYFEERLVRASSHPIPFERRREPIDFAMRESRDESFATFEALLAENDTRAFLVLHHDVIVYEHYFGRVTAETRLPAFSISKTFGAVLVGAALRDGLIDSVQQPLVEFVPALSNKPGYSEITLEHLLRMTSGIDFDEESTAGAMLYYTTDLRSLTHTYDVRTRPGQHYQYGSVSTQLLWEVLQSRLGDRTVARYFEQRLWEPIGAERPAAWSLDSAERGVEKLSSGLSATTRDYARLGVLFQHGGRVRDQPVISEQWVEDSLAQDDVAGVVRTTDGEVRRGRYEWFLTLDGLSYFAKGYHGQYIFVERDRDVVVVRFGEGYGKIDWTVLFEQIAQSL
jgi:CubicO group peptidase (beta-lactamase class C family)